MFRIPFSRSNSYVMPFITFRELLKLTELLAITGSVYHWAGMVVPKDWNAICSYTCGWTNFLGNAAGDATYSWSWTQFLAACISLSGGEQLSIASQVAISIAVLLIWTFLNGFNVAEIGWVNSIAAVVQARFGAY